MRHSEFRVTVKKTIFENGGGVKNAPYYEIGSILTITENEFNSIKCGDIIRRFTARGEICFDKYNFKNEVDVTHIDIEYQVRKLGQRKEK